MNNLLNGIEDNSLNEEEEEKKLSSEDIDDELEEFGQFYQNDDDEQKPLTNLMREMLPLYDNDIEENI